MSDFLISQYKYGKESTCERIHLCRHEADRLEQEAKGRLERQKISDEAEAERSRKELLELQANSAAVESTGSQYYLSVRS